MQNSLEKNLKIIKSADKEVSADSARQNSSQCSVEQYKAKEKEKSELQKWHKQMEQEEQ